MITSDEYASLCQRYKIPKISLDFYTDNYNCVPSKEMDHMRCLEISLTEYGAFRPIQENEFARLRLLKPDDTYVFTDCDILENGKVLAKFDHNILAASGKAKFDILITNTSIKSDDQFVYSTKLGYIDISPTPYSNDAIESTDEFSALNNLLLEAGRHIDLTEKLQKEITEAEAIRNQNETVRQQNENERQINTSTAINNAEQATQSANTATQNANDATEAANTAVQNTNDAISNANTATQNANDAADRANTAAQVCEDLVAGTNVVMSSEKGVANGVATLDENGKIPFSQLHIYELISATEPEEGLQQIGDFWLQEY